MGVSEVNRARQERSAEGLAPGRESGSRVRRRTLGLLSCGVALLVVLTACMSDPPPPVRDTGPPPTPTEYPVEKTIYIATDSVGAGFNPHIAADQNPVTTAVAAMTLPSAFAPVQTPGGTVWELQSSFVTSAEVTSRQPFTVTYRIHTDAQWSDGLPVTGDDFSYLWQQMSRQPNVVAPAGYRLIDSVASSAGGKVVEVRFERPYPAWRELFTGLLPSHVLKGAPAGFQTGMDAGKPVSAGPFAIVGIDKTRDEVRLARNDRYWVKPPRLDQIVLRRAGSSAQMLDSVRSGDSAIVALGASPATDAELVALPGLETARSLTSRSLGVSVNARTEAMSSLDVRRAVLGLIDPRLTTFAGAGDWVVEPYANTVFAPSDPGYRPVSRPRPRPAEVDALLAAAGYRRAAPEPVGSASPVPSASEPSSSASSSPAPSAAGSSSGPSQTPVPGAVEVPELPEGLLPVQKDGQDLIVRVGAVAGDPRATSAAASIVDQLRGAGVRAQVVTMPNGELYGSALTTKRVDLVVGWNGLGVPPAASLASQVDCNQPKPGTEPSPATPPTPTSVAPGGTDAGDSYASNVSGLCDPRLIELARTALSEEDPTDTLDEAEPLLAAQAIYLPLYQDSMVVGVTPAVRDVPLTGPIQVSIFGTAVDWELS
ncbi:ABC transporter family substrate-binding protein [Gordonia jinghuaiqii]|uniref:ABC transporter family substrate-binding protein n=1 Tax=Gordonia jinghuaiqii TaxID=2758710 RepID=A0A7D7LWA5_9ACTN|nr:ABC transporter family substrate-binding protein [Gordonia jinghuaiqii]MCR5976943.1 ABC transporter family substrate-binding protein [Gordonia jinghuaiqii]QMT00436.1 ABC transporter family substrate-binding protein [Gordonia jinghuaiqii]